MDAFQLSQYEPKISQCIGDISDISHELLPIMEDLMHNKIVCDCEHVMVVIYRKFKTD